MSKILIPTTFNIDLEFESAAFHVRMFAWILDFVLQVFYIILSFYAFYYIMSHRDLSESGSGYDLWSIQLLIMLPVFTYHLLCEVFWNGQSVGKKLLGLRVVNDNGGKASVGQYILRWLLRSSDLSIPVIIIASLFANASVLKALWITVLMFIADLILIATSQQGKRLGDLAAGTMVIRAKNKGSLEDTIFMEVADDYVPVYPQVMRLSDRDINTIKGIADNGFKSGNMLMLENAAARVKKVLAIEDEMPAHDFLNTLLKDYNYLSTKAS
jgi:uncharacterized RDD family membrane protein YckC